jgi:transposase-like protein
MTKSSYKGYRFPPEIIQQAIWLYLRFTLSFRDVEDLLAERGIMVSYETVRRWVNHFGPVIAADLRKRRPKPHTTWHLDEVYLKIDGRMVALSHCQEHVANLPARQSYAAATASCHVCIAEARKARCVLAETTWR